MENIENPKNWTTKQRAEEETKLAEYLISRVSGKAAGRLEDVCLYDLPRDKYFIGNLRSTFEDTKSAKGGYFRFELMRKVSPAAFGGDFLLSRELENFSIGVTITWACYYRVFPTHDEQKKFASPQDEDGNPKNTDHAIIDSLAENDDIRYRDLEAINQDIESRFENGIRRKQQFKGGFLPKFQKISCKATGTINIYQEGNKWEINDKEIKQAISRQIDIAHETAKNDPNLFRASQDLDKQVKIDAEAIKDAENFRSALEKFDMAVIPGWDLSFKVVMGSDPVGKLLSFVFENKSPMPSQSFNRESYLFDLFASFEFDKDIVRPFELELAPRGFRYDRHLWGRGFNCGIIKQTPQFFKTTHTPGYIQERFDTRAEPEARFDSLSIEPIPVLHDILNAMRAYLKEWDEAEKTYRDFYGSEWEGFFREFETDRTRYEKEIERFENGLNLIEADEDVRLAFKLTNETFKRAGEDTKKPKTNWRLFQIVFVVTQIPGIAALRSRAESELLEREIVDIIYFPTGGGKTEAYLGVLVFHCFFDRLRGKTAGVTAWLRFPLRLLTLQQTQRMADIIGTAEILRQEQTDSRLITSVAGFGVGYFVGESSSPNALKPFSHDPKDQIAWSKANDPVEREKWKRVVTCPSCRTNSVIVDLDEVQIRVVHRCTNKACRFPNGKIPIYVVDNEIYRYLPCVLVGTIDKLAGVGNQRKFSTLLGRITGYCQDHGFFSGKCSQDGCKDEKKWKKDIIPVGLSGPTLFVQDELHLLREGLGTFDGHYETFIQELLEITAQEGPLKIIASSATIEAFERQVKHLYGRDSTLARIFPGTGPTLGNSFYAQTKSYPQRLFLGIIPHNKTIFNSILELLEFLHIEIQILARTKSTASNPYGGQVVPNGPYWNAMIDSYRTTLTYFLANRELSSARTDLESHVNANLEAEGLDALNIIELTGNTSTGEVAKNLEALEQPYSTGHPDTVLATSMVSHGVDIDRFNIMVFYGMPRQNAEYIQASSRVGRNHVGIVLVCLHPVRERDQSHYDYFNKFHEYLGQLIEPVAINRWSKFSIERTLPGLFMGVLLQLLANRPGEKSPNSYYLADFIQKKISQGEIRLDQFVPFLLKAYRVEQPKSPIEKHFFEIINSRIRAFLDQITSPPPQATFVSDAIYPKPMRSLRDVDETVEIELDDLGSKWASNQ